MHDEYRQVALSPVEPVEHCPCCGSSATVWEYSQNPTDEVTRVVMCDHQGDLGPRDSLVYTGCLLSMPPEDFYKATGREAVLYWNDYAKSLNALRRSNNWTASRVLRQS